MSSPSRLASILTVASVIDIHSRMGIYSITFPGYNLSQQSKEVPWRSTNGTKKERVWEADHGLLDEEQVARCARADEAEPFRSPVPTRMISNGEYMPVPQTDKQKQVEARIQELAESASKKLGIDRRRFLAGPGGMAAVVARDERSVRTVLQRRSRSRCSSRRRTPNPARLAICSSSTISFTWFAAASGSAARNCGRSPRVRRRRPLSSRIRSTRKGCPTSTARCGESGTRRSSACRSPRRMPRSCSSSRTSTWTAR